MTIIAPSILSADFSKLGEEIKAVEEAGAEWLHIDVMDGHFVPNITIGIPVVKSIRKVTDLFFDVHLMIENPERYIESFASAGADGITVHIEACKESISVLRAIRENKCKAGISLKPATPLDTVKDILDHIDILLIMTVNPGFGGQKFMPEVLPKIRKARKLIDESGLDILLEVDGGICKDNAKMVREAGADVLVSGSFVFRSDDYRKAIESLLL
ncbi:MAG TPA: ribulose-phosphate 3-epimerase [Thermoplasmatales archaeon]|nr:ribulose-phosphate 3-epimerase [Thermoplasmatales archaeon]